MYDMYTLLDLKKAFCVSPVNAPTAEVKISDSFPSKSMKQNATFNPNPDQVNPTFILKTEAQVFVQK